MKDKLRSFMIGRYGTDQLNKFLLIVTMVLIFLSMFTRQSAFWYGSLVLLVYSYYRMFSRNISRRYQENTKYLQMTSKIRGRFQLFKTHQGQRKIYRFYKCPNCKQKVRVPKGRGKISITCPNCKGTFIKRS